jgi:hypothetical protein
VHSWLLAGKNPKAAWKKALAGLFEKITRLRDEDAPFPSSTVLTRARRNGKDKDKGLIEE